MERTTATLPVFRDGTFTFEVELPALVDEAGETFVTLKTALRWERLQEQAAMTIPGSSRLPRRRRSWYRNAGTLARPVATGSSRETVRLRNTFA
jgi:hypothetical protein